MAGFFIGQAVAQQFPGIAQFEEDEVAITLDGFVDETVWQSIPIVDGMKMTEPDTCLLYTSPSPRD